MHEGTHMQLGMWLDSWYVGW